MDNVVAVGNDNKVLFIDSAANEYAVFMIENGVEHQKTRWTTLEKTRKSFDKIVENEL